jgi:hypothetical protein
VRVEIEARKRQRQIITSHLQLRVYQHNRVETGHYNPIPLLVKISSVP